MTTLFRPLAATAAALGLASLGALAMAPDDPPPAPATPVAKAEPAAAAKPAVEVKFAVDPKPLGEAVKKGLKWLASQQNDDGGWSQGGGWRTDAKTGRVEGKGVTDPSDVGNTCIAVMALWRAGNTPTDGEYKDHVRKGLKYIAAQVDKADAKDLYVTDVRNTQLQSKIGPFVDTFFTALVLAEVKGKGGDDEKKLAAALDKTLAKMSKNQQADGTFAGNGGWAPVLSQGVANKALSRAKLNGAKVDDQVFARATAQSRAALAGTPAQPAAGVTLLGFLPVTAAPKAEVYAGRGRGDTRALSSAGPGFAPTSGGFAGGGLGGVGDAGVPLYGRGQALGNYQDVLNGVQLDAEAAKKVIADPKATKADKDAAEKRVKEAEEVQKDAKQAQAEVAGRVKDRAFVAGFGSNGGEEFLSFLNISEMLVIKANKEWDAWDGQMQDGLKKAQDKDGSWSGHHCITGKTFCTSAALLVMMADRTQFPVDVIKAAREAAKDDKKPDEKKPDEKK